MASTLVPSSSRGVDPNANVDSVFGRTGTVVAATNDYTDAQVQTSPTNVLTATGDMLYASGANTLARRAVGSSGNVLTVSGGLPTWAAPASGAGGLAVYGDGSDGTVTFDGSTTILGLVPSSNVYTAIRDLYLAAGTINNGVTLKMAGFGLFVQGALTNNGTIHSNGADGITGGNGGAGGGAGTLGVAGGPGGNGATGTGGAGSAASKSFGGSGGAGGAGVSAAGAAGTASVPTAGNGSPHSWINAQSMGSIFQGGSLAQSGYQGGAGGGGGGGDATNKGGGGGGGGGQVLVVAKTITGTGAIQSRGGIGGNGAVASTLGCGGGGGGGGGHVVVASSSVSSGTVAGQTIDAAGGTGGSKQGTTGAAGSAGAAGNTFIFPN